MKKTCLVTGSSGFIGSHVADYLSKKNFSVRLFDKKKSKFKKKNQKSVIGSLKNFYDLDKATKKIDTLFHFAASADLNHANNKPFEAIQDNIMGTSNILKACIKNKVKKIIFASSIYAISEQGGIYSTTKLASEMIIEKLCKKHSLNYVILRFGTVYGTRANKFNTVQNFINEAKLKKKIYRETKGNEIRSYINVKDVVKIVYLLNKKKYENNYYNIFGNKKTKVKKLLGMIKKKIPKIKIHFSKKDKRKYNYKVNPFKYKLRRGKKIKLDKYMSLENGINELIDI